MKHAQLALKDLDKDAEKLRLMSDEVARISRALDRLAGTAGGMSVVGEPTELSPETGRPNALEEVRSVISSRKMRTRFFPDSLFADPAWDMLLELFQAELEQTRVSISKLCTAAEVPYTTALRWLNTLTEDGMLARRDDPIDKRRVFIELSPDTSEAMRRYFVAVAKQRRDAGAA